jgi:hypothetical protein
MSIQEIVSTAKAQLDEIEARSPRFWTDLGVDEVSVVLRIVGESFRSINQLARESDGADESKLLTQEQLRNVLGLLNDLGDNFFPMAHTQEPLGALKIINGEEANRLDSFQERSIDGLSARMRTLSEIINETSNLLNDTQAEINNLKRFQEQMHQVLNP